MEIQIFLVSYNFQLVLLDFPGIPTWGHPLRDWYRRFRILTSKEPAAISNFDQGARPPCVAGADRLAGPGQPSQLGQLARAAAQAGQPGSAGQILRLQREFIYFNV